MARNFQVGDRVKVYETGSIAAMAVEGHFQIQTTPRLGTVLRQHPSEPGTYEVAYDDGGSELVSDAERMRVLPQLPRLPKPQPLPAKADEALAAQPKPAPRDPKPAA